MANNIIEKLNSIVKETGEKLEGNCLYKHHTDFVKRTDSENVVSDLKALSRISNSLFEIGVNAGHSLAIMKEANENLQIKCCDLCFHSYTEKCCEFLEVNLLKGNSKKVVPQMPLEIFDLIHIDGGHTVLCLKQDIENCKRLSNENTKVLIDDTNFKRIKALCDEYIAKGFLKEISEEYNINTKTHRLYQYVF
tara:strand:- start:118 stop:696 length:579 start_codon:yes stop_codon:yes gene_type:complete